MYGMQWVMGMGPARSLLWWTAVSTLALSGLTACDKEETPPGASVDSEAAAPLADILLPVSLRTSDPAPAGAAAVEATIKQLRVDGTPVAELTDGKVAEGDRTAEGVMPKLEAALRSPARSGLALRLQANIPYETVALVLNTAHRVGIHDVAFQVRKAGATDATGFMQVRGFVTSSKAESLPEIPGVAYKPWNAFTDQWQPAFDGCRTAKNGNCAYVNENVAQGGTLRVELMTSGQAVTVNFFRRGLTPAQEKEEDKKLASEMARKKEDFIQGRITEEEMVEALLLGHPSTYALFQFRHHEALTAPSPLSKTIAPVCGSERCAVVVTGDRISPFVRIASMLGAAFPDGKTMPAIAFELPWTDKPKPADLQAFIDEQRAKGG